MTTEKRAKAQYLIIVFAIPMLLVGYANAVLAFNHFYQQGAFIYDSGWFSAVVYRGGLSLPNPPTIDPHPLYWQLHVSLLFFASSLASYLAPLDRIDFFWVWQGLLYLPFGAAVGVLVPPGLRPRKLPGILFVGALALIFTFNGQALACMGFPHYEIFLVGGICFMLAGLATERLRLAWLGLFMCIATREDGGGHAATFLAAVLACDLLGRPFPVARREVMKLLVVGTITTLLLMATQRFLLHGGSLFREEYLGEPAYGHITVDVLSARAEALFLRAEFVLAPFAAAIVIAALDRDGRWLLGWVSTIPWFILNFLAVQHLKTAFEIYTGFPFIGSMFWMGAYGVVKYGPRVSSLSKFALCTLVSIFGIALSKDGHLPFQIFVMSRPLARNTAAIRDYARGLRANAYGRVLVDPCVGALALESIRRDTLVDDYSRPSDLEPFGAYSFYRHAFIGPLLFDPVVRGGFTSCGRLPETDIVFCTRPGKSLPPGFLPYPVFIDALFVNGSGGTREGGDEVKRMFVEPGALTDVGVHGPGMRANAGVYRATVELRPTDDTACTARLEATFMYWNGEPLGKADIPLGHGPASFDFELRKDTDPVELRFFRTTCRYEIMAVSVALVSRGSSP